VRNALKAPMRQIVENAGAEGPIVVGKASAAPATRTISKRTLGRSSETGTVQPLDVRVGDRVLFGKWSGTEVIIEGEESTDHERRATSSV
jgi:chaperonin GroES